MLSTTSRSSLDKSAGRENTHWPPRFINRDLGKLVHMLTWSDRLRVRTSKTRLGTPCVADPWSNRRLRFLENCSSVPVESGRQVIVPCDASCGTHHTTNLEHEGSGARDSRHPSQRPKSFEPQQAELQREMTELLVHTHDFRTGLECLSLDAASSLGGVNT